MNAVTSIFKEVISLFVDDENLAGYCVLLIAVVALLAKYAGLTGASGGAFLIAGCLVILYDSVSRAVRKGR
jgi:hypothetical protein